VDGGVVVFSVGAIVVFRVGALVVVVTIALSGAAVVDVEERFVCGASLYK